MVNFDQVVVTPKAKSGRAEVSRELLDASPGLADQIISGALRESYAQMCESTMAGVLVAGATPGPAGGPARPVQSKPYGPRSGCCRGHGAPRGA